jgi:hypothetical protein
MCTYLTMTTDVTGSGLVAGDWMSLDRSVVYFDHPQDAPVEHALCLDFRGPDQDPASRVSVELDAASARRLAETILSVLDSPEAREVAV